MMQASWSGRQRRAGVPPAKLRHLVEEPENNRTGSAQGR